MCVQPSYVICHLLSKFEASKVNCMKKIVTLIVLIASFLFADAQVNAPVEDVLKLKETEHDFDKIPQGKPVYYNFDITNTGKTEMKLDNVQASCGCTTPEWSHDPIAPGATSKIKIGYNAAAEGHFEKSITVTYNSTQVKIITIKGTVWKAPEGSAPANASVDFLKKQTF